MRRCLCKHLSVIEVVHKGTYAVKNGPCFLGRNAAERERTQVRLEGSIYIRLEAESRFQLLPTHLTRDRISTCNLRADRAIRRYDNVKPTNDAATAVPPAYREDQAEP